MVNEDKHVESGWKLSSVVQFHMDRVAWTGAKKPFVGLIWFYRTVKNTEIAFESDNLP